MEYQIQFLVFFWKNPIPSDLNLKNWFWGHIFPHICGFMGPIVSKNNRFTHEWTRINRVNFMKISSKLRLYRHFLYIY